jgi:pimeloyl-ACP methyl ester carboxylesterase
MKRKRIYGDAPRVGRDRSGPAPSSRAPALAPKPKTSLLERAAGEGAITDAEGLARSYAQGDAYTHGSTTYIAGTHTARDWWDDVTKIPFWGDSYKIYRMQMAQKALATNPQTAHVVGHSLGGAVALRAQKDNPKLASRTYGAPVWDPFGADNTERGYGMFDKAQGKPGEVERHRSYGDPVSFFGGSAKSSLTGKEALSMSGPHAYQGLAAQHMSEGLAAHANPDGTVSISE